MYVAIHIVESRTTVLQTYVILQTNWNQYYAISNHKEYDKLQQPSINWYPPVVLYHSFFI